MKKIIVVVWFLGRFLRFFVIFVRVALRYRKGLQRPISTLEPLSPRNTKSRKIAFSKFFWFSRKIWTITSRLVWSPPKSAFWAPRCLKKRPRDPPGAQNPSYGPLGQKGGLAANFRDLPKNDHPAKLGDDHTKITPRVHSFQKNLQFFDIDFWPFLVSAAHKYQLGSNWPPTVAL